MAAPFAMLPADQAVWVNTILAPQDIETIPFEPSPRRDELDDHHRNPLTSSHKRNSAVPESKSPRTSDKSPRTPSVRKPRILPDLREHVMHPNHTVVEHSTLRPLVFVLFFIGVVVGVKLLAKYYGEWKGVLDSSDASMLITGLFFILGQMMGQLNSDFKESEKLPAELAASLEQIDDQFYMAEPKVAERGCSHADEVRPLLLHLARAILAQMMGTAPNAYNVCMHDLRVILALCHRWEANGGNCGYMTGTVDRIRRSIGRMRVISRTAALPVGQTLLTFFVASSSLVLFLATYKTDAAMVVTLVVIYSVTWVLTLAIRSMDDPFDQESAPWGQLSSVDVSPVAELIERFERLATGVEPPLLPAELGEPFELPVLNYQ